MDEQWRTINIWGILLTYAPSNSESPYLPVTFVYPTTADELTNRFPKVYTDISSRLNVREISIYPTTEVQNGQQWFTTNPQVYRFGFRKVFSVGAIAAGATSTTAHGLTGNPLVFTYIGGTAITDAVDQRPIPYASATAVNTQIQILCDGTNIKITNGAAAPNITSAIVILEYLKN